MQRDEAQPADESEATELKPASALPPDKATDDLPAAAQETANHSAAFDIDSSNTDVAPPSPIEASAEATRTDPPANASRNDPSDSASSDSDTSLPEAEPTAAADSTDEPIVSGELPQVPASRPSSAPPAAPDSLEDPPGNASAASPPEGQVTGDDTAPDRFDAPPPRDSLPAGQEPVASSGQPLPRVQVLVLLAEPQAALEEIATRAANRMASKFQRLAGQEVRHAEWVRQCEARAADYRLRGPG